MAFAEFKFFAESSAKSNADSAIFVESGAIFEVDSAFIAESLFCPPPI
ncbi:hypothetical protein ACWIUD_09855 [Helicobacter sp. 23-1044]